MLHVVFGSIFQLLSSTFAHERVPLFTRWAVGESDAVSGVTLGLLVFPLVDGGDDLVVPSPPMMAHLLSLGTQSEDAAEAPQS